MSSGYTPYTSTGGDAKGPLMPPGTPGWSAGATFADPATSGSAWTGVSSNADPYGIHNVGYDISKIPTQLNNKGGTTDNLGRDTLLRAGGYAPGEGITDTPGGPTHNQSNTSFMISTSNDLPDSLKFSGYSKYENQNPADGSALGSDASRIQAQTQNSQNNMNAMQSGYPAYGNQYGLGGQIPSAAQSDYSGKGVTVNVPDTSSRGFNPWSIQGESNVRDTQSGVST